MIRKLLRKLGAARSALIVTAFTISFSVSLYTIIGVVLNQFAVIGIVMAVTVPAIVAPLVSYYLLQVSFKLEMAEQAFENFQSLRNEVAVFPQTPTVLAELKENFQLAALTNGNSDVKFDGIHFFCQSGGIF